MSPAAELAAEKQRAKDIIVTLKREVESVLVEGEQSAGAMREASAAALARAQAEAARQGENCEWLAGALERSEARVHALEQHALSVTESEAGHVERAAAAAAKARAPLEARLEGVQVRPRRAARTRQHALRSDRGARRRTCGR